MIKELNKKSLIYGIPGLIIQSVFLFINPLISLLGSILLIIGLAYYAKAKGHSGYFGIFGILGIIGLLVLIPLKDKYLSKEEVLVQKTTKRKDIILGILLGLGLIIGVPIIIFILFNLFVK
ncbi:MAG: hypothetical protein AB1472_00885 [Candidatus Omnitrophota bacterium]